MKLEDEEHEKFEERADDGWAESISENTCNE